jgi:SRSO17 transposase
VAAVFAARVGEHPERRKKAGVPAEINFGTKPHIALEQIREAKAAGVPVGVVLADAGYGNDTDFRESLGEMGLKYCVGVQPATSVWTAQRAPLPPKPRRTGKGRPPTRLRRARGHEPISVRDLAHGLSARALPRSECARRIGTGNATKYVKRNGS